MSLHILTVTSNIYCPGGGMIPKGARVEVPAPFGCHMDYEDAKDAFERKYGLRPGTDDIQLRCDKEEIR